MKLSKKGQVFNNLSALGIGIAGLAITLTITFLIISQGRAQIVDVDPLGNMSLSYNSTQTLGNAVDAIPGWVPLIVIASVGAVLIGLVSLFRR